MNWTAEACPGCLADDCVCDDPEVQVDRDSWIAGYAAALEFCADDESRCFWPSNSSPHQAAAAAWDEKVASEGDA